VEADHGDALAQWRLAVERANYEAQRAERRYRAIDPLCVVRKNVAPNAFFRWIAQLMAI
jgi:hypothetical protein